MVSTVTTKDDTLTRANPVNDKGAIIYSTAHTGVVIGDIVELDETTTGFRISDYPHVFLGILMYTSTDGTGTPVAASTAGTFTISIKTKNTMVYESVPTSTISATAPTTIDWAANTFGVKVEITASLTTNINSWRVAMTVNRT